MTGQSGKKGISRREAVKGLAAAGASALVPGLAFAQQTVIHEYRCELVTNRPVDQCRSHRGIDPAREQHARRPGRLAVAQDLVDRGRELRPVSRADLAARNAM